MPVSCSIFMTAIICLPRCEVLSTGQWWPCLPSLFLGQPSRGFRWADIFSCPCLAHSFSHSLTRLHQVIPVTAPSPASTWDCSKEPSGQVVSLPSDKENRPWQCIGPKAIITPAEGTETPTALAPWAIFKAGSCICPVAPCCA